MFSRRTHHETNRNAIRTKSKQQLPYRTERRLAAHMRASLLLFGVFREVFKHTHTRVYESFSKKVFLVYNERTRY
jgi:hypothetical protein